MINKTFKFDYFYGLAIADWRMEDTALSFINKSQGDDEMNFSNTSFLSVVVNLCLKGVIDWEKDYEIEFSFPSGKSVVIDNRDKLVNTHQYIPDEDRPYFNFAKNLTYSTLQLINPLFNQDGAQELLIDQLKVKCNL